MNELIKEKLETYNCKTPIEELNAIKEITQEVVLFALSKTDFFKNAHFCGGTALRIVHSLNRFSEDLDFSTTKVDPDFSFDNYMDEVLSTLKDLGLEMKVKKEKDNGFVKAREIKEDSEKWELSFPNLKRLKKVMIKLEIDTNPPGGSLEENEFLDFPYLHSINIGSIETLFAGKLHALLCRSFVKGRDWYDLLWYIKKNTGINYDQLANALKQMGPFKDQDIKVDRDFVVRELSKKIEQLNWKEVVHDVEKFLKSDEVLSLNNWSKDLFLSRVNKIVS